MTRPAPTVTDHPSALVSVPRADLVRIEKKLRHGGWPTDAKAVRSMLAAPAAPQAAGVGEIAQIITGYRNMGDEGDPNHAIAHLCDLLERQSLRAQPQAREDAQLVGPVFFTGSENPEDRWIAQKYPDGSCSISERNPAPDAQRVAVEAIGKAVVVRAFCASDPLSYRLEFSNEDDRLAAANAIDQALAALQAEQGEQ